MNDLLLCLAVLAASGILALAASSRPRLASAFGAGGVILAAALGLPPTVRILLGAPTEAVKYAWNVPSGSLALAVDPLSAFFLAPILVLSAVAAIYGIPYLLHHAGKRSLGPPWFFTNLLVASLCGVVLARNGILFLLAWESMSLASFFLVTFDDEDEGVRRAGWTYLVAAHLGTAFLLVLFLILAKTKGSLDFDVLESGAAPAAAVGGLAFAFAILGFGSKAGFYPLHVWLPEAHPAAPSHISALMSGVLIKTGIYGILRTLGFLGTPQAWWGWTLVAIGAVSGTLGVLHALAERDLKRLLAYSSVENVGIIALGLGLGIVGFTAGLPALAVLAAAGGLLHVWNHALFKGLLFLGAGSVLHSTGTRDSDRLGGLLRSMPWTGSTFLVGAAAICALPPLNGFVGEFLIYLGALETLARAPAEAAVPALLTVVALALIGGLAAACFTRAFGTSFLGFPRSPAAEGAHEAPWPMVLATTLLAAGCLAMGFLAPWGLRILEGPIAVVSHIEPAGVRAALDSARPPLVLASFLSGGLIVLAGGLSVFRRVLLSSRSVTRRVTWDCGYADPRPRMQYTGSSFTQPLVELFRRVLGTRVRLEAPRGVLPAPGSFETNTPDGARVCIFEPLFRGVGWTFARLRWIQHGRVQVYVLYVALTLLVLLLWKLGTP
jgi:formate hydrogenlyase subunit 3/multisubunit Na+/H+ antiporter MnhD subunit